MAAHPRRPLLLSGGALPLTLRQREPVERCGRESQWRDATERASGEMRQREPVERCGRESQWRDTSHAEARQGERARQLSRTSPERKPRVDAASREMRTRLVKRRLLPRPRVSTASRRGWCRRSSWCQRSARQVNSITREPKPKKCLIPMFQSGLDFECPYSNRPLKPSTPLIGFNAICV